MNTIEQSTNEIIWMIACWVLEDEKHTEHCKLSVFSYSQCDRFARPPGTSHSSSSINITVRPKSIQWRPGESGSDYQESEQWNGNIMLLPDHIRLEKMRIIAIQPTTSDGPTEASCCLSARNTRLDYADPTIFRRISQFIADIGNGVQE